MVSAMPTDKERREVAAKLRDIAVRTNPSWPALMEALGTPGRAVAVMHLADLIEPEERRCRVVTDIRALSQTQDMHVKSCSACGYVFGSEQHCQLLPGIDKRVAIKSVVIPNYCPSCGAKVVEQ